MYHSIPQYTIVTPQYSTIRKLVSLHREEIDKKLEKLKTVERELTNKEQELQEVCVARNYERRHGLVVDAFYDSKGEVTQTISSSGLLVFFSARETHPGKGEATGVQDKNKSEPVLP